MPKIIIENLSNMGITRQSIIQNGFSVQKYDDVQRGKSSYKLQDIIELSEKFQLSLDYLVYGKEPTYAEQLSTDQRELLDKYKQLTPWEQGRVFQFISDIIDNRSSTPENAISTPDTDPDLQTATNSKEKKRFA